jgi:hypothetical protein
MMGEAEMRSNSTTAKIVTYLGDDLEKEILDEYFRVKSANDVRSRSEEETLLVEDQFEPGRKDLVGLVIAYEGDELVGGIKLFMRKLVFENESYVLGGIGGVFTAKPNQRHGVATLMLGKAMLGLRQLKADVAYLCTDIEKLEKLYWPFGFRYLSQGHTYLGKSGKRYIEYDGMLAIVNSLDLYFGLMTSKKPIDIGMGNW